MYLLLDVDPDRDGWTRPVRPAELLQTVSVLVGAYLRRCSAFPCPYPIQSAD